MITDTDPPRRDRTLRVALLLSLVVHGSGAAIVGAHLQPVQKFLRHARVQPTPEQFVTISDSMRIDRKAVVPPAQRRASVRHAVRPQPPQPVSQAVAALPVPRPVAPAPPTPKPVPHRVKHELAKTSPHARARPSRTVVALAPPVAPTEPPRTPPPATPEPTHVARLRPDVRPPKTVAVAERAAPARPARARLTPEQIAQIDTDLEKTIVQSRKEENPLRVPKTAAAAPHRYKMSVDSVHVGSLKSGEGTYWPLDQGRRGSDGYIYYHCAYAYQWADGTFERGVIPWLVRFAPSEDPIEHPELTQGGPIGLPPPPPSFQLASGAHVGRALRSYFPGVVFTDE